ncbi:hypothetical protein ACVWWG_005823 [Bradyrhizobium sp. LB7.2]
MDHAGALLRPALRRMGGSPAGGARQGLSDQPAAQCRARASARHRRERAAGARRLSAADRGKPQRRPAIGAQSAARQHHPDRQSEAVDHRRHCDADPVQRFPHRQQRARRRTPGSSRAARRCAMSARACCSTRSPPTPTCSPTSRWSRRSAPTSRSCAKRSPSPSAASTPAMSRRPTAPRPRRGSTAGFPISTPPKSRWR